MKDKYWICQTGGRFPTILMTEPPYVTATFRLADRVPQTDRKVWSIPVEGFNLEIYKTGVFAPSDVRVNTLEILQEMKEFAIVNIIHSHYGHWRKFAINKEEMEEQHKFIKAMIDEEKENAGNRWDM